VTQCARRSLMLVAFSPLRVASDKAFSTSPDRRGEEKSPFQEFLEGEKYTFSRDVTLSLSLSQSFARFSRARQRA